MNDEITPEMESKIAKAIMENKPYLLALEEHIQKVAQNSTPKGHGTIELKLDIRGGQVTKMQFWSGSNWLKEKYTEENLT